VAEPVFGSTGPGPSIVLRAEKEETRAKFMPDIVGRRKACGSRSPTRHGSDLTGLTTSAKTAETIGSSTAPKGSSPACPLNELYATFVPSTHPRHRASA